MKFYRALLLLSVIVFGSAIFTSTAQAQCWGGVGGFGGFGGYRYAFNSDVYYNRFRTVPYFALHPPVYYGRRTALTYGDSPLVFPYSYSSRAGQPRQVQVSRQAVSQVISNPYVEGDNADELLPKVIVNPYFKQEMAPLPGVLVRVNDPPAEHAYRTSLRSQPQHSN